MVEWNSGMEYWNDLDVWGCYELQHHNGSRIGKCRYQSFLTCFFHSCLPSFDLCAYQESINGGHIYIVRARIAERKVDWGGGGGGGEEGGGRDGRDGREGWDGREGGRDGCREDISIIVYLQC